MRFSDLTREQRTEAKQRLLCERFERNGGGMPSYGELAGVDETISDKEAEEAYGGTEFVLDDFSCGVAADRDGVLNELKEWVERELVRGRLPARTHAYRGYEVDWARKALLDHIEAVRL